MEGGDRTDIIFSKEHNEFANHDDIWDDTALIKIYEESIQKTYEKVRQGSSSLDADEQKPECREWLVGDLCLAPYYENNLWYPAVIKDISLTEDSCTVLYDEYNEIANVKISELEPREEESEVSEESESLKATKSAKNLHCKRNSEKGESSRSKNFSGIPKKISNKVPKMMPPPPPMFSNIAIPNDEEVVSNMLLSWYMCGYHTGYYQAIEDERKKKKSAS